MKDGGAWHAAVKESDTTQRLNNGLGGTAVKNPPANAGDACSTLGSGRSLGEENWQSAPVLLSGKIHGQRSMVGYHPWGPKESDTNERLFNTHTR